MFKVNLKGKEVDVEVKVLMDNEETPFTKELFMEFQNRTLEYVKKVNPFSLIVTEKIIVKYGKMAGCVDILITHNRMVVDGTVQDESKLSIQISPNMKINDWIFQEGNEEMVSEFSKVCRIILSEFGIHQQNTTISEKTPNTQKKHITTGHLDKEETVH